MKAELLGVRIDALTFNETVDRARDAMRCRQPTHQVSVNVAKLVKMRSDPILRDDVLSSDIVSADGMGIIFASRLLKAPLKERVAGVDLMDAVLRVAAEEGFHPYFLGAKEDVLKCAAEKARARHPKLAFSGLHDGYFSEDEEPAIVEEIARSHAACLFIGMPTPRKERFLNAHKNALNVPFIMGVGGSFDIMAGITKRAPQWMQRTGLEWLYRIWQEPRRMWYRYASTNTAFACLLITELVRSLRRKRPRPGLGSPPASA
jgi:N-acetylglucosaminyldiphosphoundecaprenol N-acetyl-beta-D-mannosaminyltransferase